MTKPETASAALVSDLAIQDTDWLDNVHIVSGSSRLSTDIAAEMRVEPGSIINLVPCKVNDVPSLVLMAGDQVCDAEQVSRAFNLPGALVSRMAEAEITELTDTSADNLFTIPLARQWPTVMDASLQRFDKLYTHADSRRCLVETSYRQLKEMTGAIVSYALAPTDWRFSKTP